MNTDERRAELLNKANSLIDTISESMRTVENVEAAKKRFLRPDSALTLEIPVEGNDGYVDAFKFAEIFDERSIEKIKAYILTELEFLEEGALKILDTCGFHEATRQQEEIPFAPDPEEEIPEEDDSDMIIVPEKLERKGHSTKPLTDEKVGEIEDLWKQGVKPSEIARRTGVSPQSVTRYARTFSEAIDNKELKKGSGRSVSRGKPAK